MSLMRFLAGVGLAAPAPRQPAWGLYDSPLHRWLDAAGPGGSRLMAELHAEQPAGGLKPVGISWEGPDSAEQLGEKLAAATAPRTGSRPPLARSLRAPCLTGLRTQAVGCHGLKVGWHPGDAGVRDKFAALYQSRQQVRR